METCFSYDNKKASLNLQTRLLHIKSKQHHQKTSLPLTSPAAELAIIYEPVREKTNNLCSDQVQHKPGCTVTEDG